MPVTSRLVITVLVASALTSWCSASDNTGYIHVGCYYEVHKCGSPAYYIENHRPNTSIFDICLNFTSTRGWKSFGIQTLQQTDCITGPYFHTALNPFCFKPGNCSDDRGNVTRYSYDVYVKDNVSVLGDNCAKRSLGVENRDIIPDSSFIATSRYDNSYSPYRARLNGIKGWAASSLYLDDPNQYLQIDLGFRYFICAVATQGSSDGSGWVTGYKISLSMHYNLNWEPYKENGAVKLFPGNADSSTIKKHTLTQPYARYIRFIPTTYGGWKTMRVGIYGFLKEPPVFIQKPKPQTVTEGAQVEFICNATGSPVPSILWYKDGQNLAGRTSKYQISNDNITLTIKKVDRTDQGSYSCNISNSIGPGLLSSANLTVHYPPKIFVPPNNTTSVEDDTVTLTCYLEGKPVSTVTWLKDGIPIINDKRITLSSPTSVSNTSATMTIVNVNRTDEGSYSCKAVNGVGNDNSSAALMTVDFPPKILEPPTNQTAVERSSVFLTCYLEGKPVSTVTWFKDDNPIIPANDNRISVAPPTSVSNNGATMTITNVNRTDEGNYSCKAVNEVSSVMSSAALLKVNYPPKILEPPTNQTVVERSNVSLTCYLEGKPVSTVTWFKDDIKIIHANNSRISVSPPTSVSNTSATVTIPNVNRTDEGNYSCQAVNDVGNDTSSAALMTVNYPPKILVPPTNQTVVERSNVSLTCYLEGKPVSTVTWFKDDIKIIHANNSRISVSSPTSVSGTSATMTITNVSRTDEGSYSCQAVNDVGSVMSSAALMTVNFPPKILVPPTNQTVVERSSVSLTCYLEGKPVSNVTWFKDDIKIIHANNSRISVSSPTSVSNTSATMTITNVNRTDEGNYSCQAVNDVSNDTSTAALMTVNYGVTIFVHPRAQAKNEGESVTLTCEVEGKPAPVVTWFKNGNPLTIEMSRMNVTQPTTHNRTAVSLTITDLKRTEEASYSCNVNNSYGEYNSTAALLTVNYPSKILVPPTNQTVVERSNVSLTCYLEGKPVSTVSWFKDGNPIIPANDSRISVSSPSSFSNRSATMTITNVNRTDEGNYSCQAVNEVSSVMSSAALLTVNYPSRIFVAPSATTSVERSSVSLICYLEGKPLSNVTWWKDGNPVKPTSKEKRIYVVQPTSVTNTSTSITITNVNRTDEGRYCCQAEQHPRSDQPRNFTFESRCSPLVVNYGARIFVGPRSEIKKEGDSVTIACEVEGKPVPEITWLKNNKSLTIDHNRMITNQTKTYNRTLVAITINNLRRTDEGRYSCRVNNSLNEQISDPALLTVNYPPRILSHPKSVTKMEKQSVTLSCEVEGKPISQVTWFKEKIQIRSNSRINITQPITETRTRVYLRINQLASDDQGNYRCKVKNYLGNKTSNPSYLTVNYKPRITKQLTNKTIVIEGKPVSFVCHYDGNPEPKVQWFKDNIEIKPDQDPRMNISSDGNTMTVKKARKNDEGRYECRVKNGFGHDNSSGTLVVQYDGSFAVRPRNQTYIEGQKVTLTCNRYGMPNAKVHWMMKKDNQGSTIDMLQDGTQLTISKIRRTDQGSYRCKAYNDGIFSFYGYVNVEYKPKILQPPSRSTAANEKGSVTLTCTFEGKPFPSITWLKNGQKVDINSNDRMSGNVSQIRQEEYIGTAKLHISKLKRDDQGNFSCSIRNKINSSLSEGGFLEIRYPPVIFSSPRNITKNESDQVQFSCTMEGNPKPTVSWQKDGHIIDQSQDDRITVETKGNSSLWESTITINSLKDTDGGGYFCVATNAATEKPVRSKTGKLVVHFLHDVFIFTPNPYILTRGQKKASLQCHAVGFPQPDLSWYKEGTIISDSQIKNSRSIVPGEPQDDRELLLTASDNYTGNYTCVAYSRTLNKTTRGTVEVLFKPEIQQKPTDQTVIQGTQVSFYCNATGVPEPVISWRFSDGSTPKHTGNKIVIDNVQNTKEYEGRYTCIASSRAGRTEESASLNILVPPTRKDVLPRGVMLQLGQTLQLTCDVYGDPEPSFKWTKRLRIPKEAKRKILANQKKYRLEIPDVRFKDAAYYGCTATNKVGKLTLDDVFIDVDTSLDIINSDQTFNATSESSTIISCIASSKVFIEEVKLFKDSIELKTRRSVSNDDKVVKAEFDLTIVSTDDSGRYTCVAKNRQKEVKAHVFLTVNVPIKVEMDVSLKNKTFTEELHDNSSQEYSNLTAEFIREMTKVYENETGFLRIEVLGLSNGSVAVRFRVLYRIKVQNPKEKPPPDAKVRIANVLVRRVTKSDGIVGKLVLKAESLKPRVKPPAPRNVTAINIKKTSMTIHWSPPLFDDHYSVENYVVKCKEFASPWKKLDAGGQHVNTLFLEDLEPDTSYSIKAHAMNHVGEGLPSDMIEVKTHSNFWSKFTKIFVPLFVLLVIGVVIGLLYLRRRRMRRGAKLMTEVEGKRCYDEFHDGPKKLECGGGDAIEMVELPMRCRSIPRENLELGKELGSGQFGVVFKGFLKEKGEDEDVPCAVKMLKPAASESDYRDLFNELEIMCSVEEHPNIVNLLGACKGGGGPLYVVVEFAENGCLLEYLRENRITAMGDDGNKDEVSSLDNQEKIRLALDIAEGMKHLASHKCVHRDLAARNVLLGKDRIAKVADFGLARDVYEQGFYEKSSTGGKLPAKWMSIEALETLKATSESDVWSFGVLLWEIESGGKMPYAGLSYMDLVKALKSGVRLQKPTNCSDELYSIMKDCWEANPEKRPKFEVLSLVLDNLLMAFLEDC